MSREATDTSTGDKITKGLVVAAIATTAAAGTEIAIDNNLISNPFTTKSTAVQPANPNAKTSFTNSEINDPKSVLPNTVIEAPHPPGVRIEPSLTVTTGDLRQSYDLAKINAKREAAVFIIGTKPDKKNPAIKETIKFDLVRLNNGEYNVNFGDKDKVNRKFSAGMSVDNMGISFEAEIPNTHNGQFVHPVESSLFALILFDEPTPSTRLQSDKTLSNPFKELNISNLKIKKIQITDPVTKVEIIFDKEYIKENKELINSLIDLFIKMGGNQPEPTPKQFVPSTEG